MKIITLRAPYLIFLGSETRATFTKTGWGLVDWRPDLCIGQHRLPGGTIDLGIPDLSISEAWDKGVKSLVIGTASVGGSIPEAWIPALTEAAELGMDIVAGLHEDLGNIPGIREAAERSGADLINVRTPPKSLPVGTGKKRSGKRLLMVGTDCAVGKKYTALQIEKDMKRLGFNADFRASGQTGIMIAGEGLPIDAVVSDFVSGAAEFLSPENDLDHWDVIEGQGGLFHPGYMAVSVGLLVGSQPDAFVVCHEARRQKISGWDDYCLPSIGEVIDRTIAIGSVTNPNIKCVGISVNTKHLVPEERVDYLNQLSSQYGLPCVDPIITGTDSIIERLGTLIVQDSQHRKAAEQ